MTPTELTEHLVDIERERLRSLVDADMEVATALHADDFVLVHPSGGAWSKDEYLGCIGSGAIDYRRFEPRSEIAVMVDGDGRWQVRWSHATEIATGISGEHDTDCRSVY